MSTRLQKLLTPTSLKRPRARRDPPYLPSQAPSYSSHHPMADLPYNTSSYGRSERRDSLSNSKDEELADLWDEALCEYKEITDVNLSDEKSVLYRRLSTCSDYRAIVAVLDETAQEFEEYRHPTRDNTGAKIRNALRPIVRAVLRTGVVEITGEAVASQAIIGGKAIFVAIGVLLKATEGVSARFDAVAALLRKFNFYVSRLNVRATGAALGPESRTLVVEIFVDMLSTFATATKMIRQNRLEHFFNVLVGKGDDLTDLARHTSELIEEETRLTLAEVHYAVSDLTADMRKALFKTDIDLRSLAVGVSEISTIAQSSQTGIVNMSAVLVEHAMHTRSTMDSICQSLVELPGRIRVQVSTRYAPDQHISPSASLLTRPQDPGIPLATVDSFVASVSMPCSDLVSFSEMTGNLVGYLQALSPEEQASVRRGITYLYATAATSILGGSPDNAIEVVIASLLCPGAVMVAFLPMALAFLAVFLFWKNVISKYQRVLPRGPDFETIFLVDVLGATFVLPLDMCSSWNDLHAFLLRQFSDQGVREVVDYIRSRDYRVTNMDSDGQSSVIEPRNWERIVRAGMKVEMSIVIRQSSRKPVCPWCRTRAPQKPYDAWIKCKTCAGRYWAFKNGAGGKTSDHNSNARPHAGLAAVDPLGKSRGREHPSGIGQFKRITVEHFLDIYAVGRAGALRAQPKLKNSAADVIVRQSVGSSNHVVGHRAGQRRPTNCYAFKRSAYA